MFHYINMIKFIHHKVRFLSVFRANLGLTKLLWRLNYKYFWKRVLFMLENKRFWGYGSIPNFSPCFAFCQLTTKYFPLHLSVLHSPQWQQDPVKTVDCWCYWQVDILTVTLLQLLLTSHLDTVSKRTHEICHTKFLKCADTINQVLALTC